MRNKILYLFASLVMLSGCNSQPAYKNSNLSPEERAEDLLQQLTLEEKVALMMDNSKPVERLGIIKATFSSKVSCCNKSSARSSGDKLLFL